ncbi:protein HIGH ARSENIC CONTENT 1, mitochondrial-like [Sesamum indicum]|uniref:Protein HIGH ARSENIC CONTENT 1, mitochondrial-like n=1 Tax=Sesamum indicum TaxID=4182 RepID=A0A8M8V8G1_SESIN|nr:protein HIGH ARSENIC CONTENT 1, mitochondrial-like [Sesamum indicum]
MDLIKKSSSGGEVITVDVLAAKDLLHQALYRYLDVRTEEEFKNGHVENTFNIPYMFNTPKGRVKNPKFVDQVLAVSGKEDHLLVEFKHVRNMGGGYIAWIGNGFAVKKPNPVEL